MAAKIEMRRSGRLGILSLALGILPLLIHCVLGGALYAANKITFDHNLKNGIAFLLTSHFFLVAPVLHFAGLVLGIVALCWRRQRKLAAAFGVALNVILPAIGIILGLFWALLSAIPPAR